MILPVVLIIISFSIYFFSDPGTIMELLGLVSIIATIGWFLIMSYLNGYILKVFIILGIFLVPGGIFLQIFGDTAGPIILGVVFIVFGPVISFSSAYFYRKSLN